jgi:S1-C subfamily serine protease
MRAGTLVILLAACSPRPIGPSHPAVDDVEDHEAASPPAAAMPTSDAQRAVAPPGKGLRTGTIERAHLLAVLDAGPGTFLRQVEVAPRLSGDRFVGWQLVQLLDHSGPLRDVDLVPGDILLAINEQPISRPEQLQVVWDSLRSANAVVARLWRGDQKLELRFAVEPAVPRGR